MEPNPPDDLQRLLDLARDYLQRNEEVRRGVAVFARALVALAESVAPAVPPAPQPEPPPPEPRHAPQPEPPPVELSQPEPTAHAPAAEPPVVVPVASLPPLTFAPPPVSLPPYHAPTGDVTPAPPGTVVARCRLKAEACRFAARRAEGEDAQADYADLIERARQLPDCNLWMLHWDGSVEWPQLAAAFETAADAAELLGLWWDLPDPQRGREASEVLHASAEAQAVLYAAVEASGRPKPDGDQIHLFVTIREEAARLQVFIRKYLKREDRANPATAPDVSQRLRALAAPLRKIADAGKHRHKAMGNLKHKARLLKADPVANAGEWHRVSELLEELTSGGVPPSNADLRELLLPLFDLVPEDLALSKGAELVFREIDRYLASRPPAEESRSDATPSAEVAEVRSLLAGTQAVLIGGQLRPGARDALEGAFGLDELQWVVTPEHESVTTFEAPIARPGVVVVLLAIRWSSHSYGDVQSYCDRYGKLLVRLPGGYHPNQVAHQILAQVGNRLRAREAATG